VNLKDDGSGIRSSIRADALSEAHTPGKFECDHKRARILRIILNTSFNLHGFPVVYMPKDALEVFSKYGLRYLALGN
jgi:carbamoyltransferase